MTAPSYVGPSVTARCTACGGYQRIPDPEAFDTGPKPGACEKCDEHAEKVVWRGVMPV